MKELLSEISKCTICSMHIEPRPVVTAHEQSKIAVVGQAPGSVVHGTGIPWDDASGKNLRQWMDVSDEVFYDVNKIALIPMGFCYPGKGKSGDLPPRPECAPHWHHEIFSKMESLKLILLIGTYAQGYYLRDRKQTLTETVKNFTAYLPRYFVLPHPSPRNNIWQAKNPWFKVEVLPSLGHEIKTALK